MPCRLPQTLKEVFTAPADRTFPFFREVFESDAGRYFPLLVASVRIVDVSAVCSLALPHIFRVCHGLHPFDEKMAERQGFEPWVRY